MPSSLRWLLLPAMALVAFLLGVAAYWGEIPPGGDWRPPLLPPQPYDFADAAYRSLQLFVLNREDPARVGPALQIARFLAPAATATWALLVFRMLAARFKVWWLRSLGRHRIVCGLGRKGLAFVRAARAEGVHVIAIELRADAPSIASAQAVGAAVVSGDAADRQVLARAGLHRAGSVVVACGEDDQNVRVLLAVIGASERRSSTAPLRLVPHIADPEVRTLLRDRVRHLDKVVGGNRYELADYCHAARAARSLFHDHPLDHAPISAGSSRFPCLILIGFGRTGQAVLLQALKIAHYPNGKQLHAVVFDREADRNWVEFVGRHRNLEAGGVAPIARLERHGCDVLGSVPQARLEELLQQQDADFTIVVALDGDASNVAAIEQLPLEVRHRQIPVHVRIHSRGGVAELVQHYRREAAPQEVPRLNLSVFGEVEATATMVPGAFPHDDEWAMRVHARYLKMVGDASPRRRSQLAWADLDEPFRDSNRHATDYAPVLLRSLGFQIVPAAEARGRRLVDILDPALQTAGRMEHMRWYAERYLAGWRYAPVRDDARLLHPDMVSWEELSEGSRKKDLDQVGGYLEDLREMGYVVVGREG